MLTINSIFTKDFVESNGVKKHVYLILLVLSVMLYMPGIVAVPTTDADEARFAQASKQMVESGNYLDIQFQDQPHYKKPIGIYWLQVASIKTAHYLGVPLNEIWPYRIPSFLAICASVLLIYFYFSRLLPYRTALFATVTMACSLGLMLEARLAKTDATLFLCAIIMYGTLGLVYKAYKEAKPVKISWLLLFYLAMGMGALIKGPMLPLMGIITILSLRFIFKEKIFKPLKFPYLLIIPILLNVPWLIWIQSKSQGLFIEESLIKDFWHKVIDFKRYFQTPPGTNTLSIPMVFGPASLILLLSLSKLKHLRKHELAPYLISWFLPMFIILEFVPKKQTNYFLPLMPAFYAMAVISLDRVQVFKSTKWIEFLFNGMMVVYLVLFCALLLLANLNIYETIFYLFIILVGATILRHCLWSYQKIKVTSSLIMVAILYSFLGFGVFLPRTESLWVTRQIKDTIGEVDSNKVVSLGYPYDSLVFEIGTGTKHSHTLEQAIQYLNQGLGKIFIVRDNFVKEFEAYLTLHQVPFKVVDQISGYNLSQLRERHNLTILVIEK